MPDGSFYSEEIVALSPRNMDEAKIAADELKQGKPTIINLSDLTLEERNWTIHFLNGVIYALGGKSKNIASKVFLYAPPNVEVVLNSDEEII